VFEGGQQPEQRVCLRRLSILLVESSEQELAILDQMMIGFAAKNITKRRNSTTAIASIHSDPPDLMIVSAALPGMDGYDLVRWLRFNQPSESRSMPVILLTAHTRAADVMKARDCGANFIVTKPIVPKVLYTRIEWISKDERPFIETKAYVGPERRFKSLGPPPGMSGRRKGDLSLQIAEATAPNMSQADIDALMNPKRGPR